MNPNILYPMFVTSKLTQVYDFYAKKLGWEVVFDIDRYKQFRQREGGPELAFATTAASEPLGVDVAEFEGRGVVVSVPVTNPDAEHERLREAGLQPSSAPSDKPWGCRSFTIADPTGVQLEFFMEKAEGAKASA